MLTLSYTKTIIWRVRHHETPLSGSFDYVTGLILNGVRVMEKKKDKIKKFQE